MQTSRFWRLAARTLFATACLPAWATPPLTTIQDVLYKANGEKFSGIAVIEWSSFEAYDSSNVAAGSLTVHIVDGVLGTQLVPTTNARPTAYYNVRYNSDGKTQFTETWTVPTSVTPVNLRAVRTVGSSILVGEETAPVEITDVTGLANELAARPVKGSEYGASSAAVIGPTGLLESAAGEPTDCVRVDGTSGPCSSNTSTSGFIDNEVPGGAVDGSNGIFTLTAAPVPESGLMVYRNGLLQRSGVDYTLAGVTITFVTAATPQSGDILLAFYRLASADPGVVPAPAPAAPTVQVLCIGNGAATSLTTATSLAQCVIPAGTLLTGDRVEARFDMAHTGISVGFTVDLKWGTATLLTRAAAATETMFTGRSDVGIHSAGAQWGSQYWGSTSSFAARVGSSTDTGLAGVTIDFLGRMASTTTETLTLRNYIVLRYLAP
jgi:hypothetical protein